MSETAKRYLARPTPWMHLAVLLSSLLCMAPSAAGPPAMPGITGKDNREPMNSRRHPWRAIGRLNGTLGGFCTATLIGPRRILTAAHCLWNLRTGTWLPPCALHFLAGYQRGGYAAHALVSEIQVVSGFRFDSPDPARDWALLTLDRDLSAVADVVALDTVPLAPAMPVIQAGYSRDRPHVLTADRSCRTTGATAEGGLVLHNCDATFGDSGSPLLVERDGRYRLAGIHVALHGHGEHSQGIAVPSRSFADWVATHPVVSPPGGARACRFERSAAAERPG